MRISLVVAVAENRVIGRDNQLPWRLPADLRRFKQLTMGHPIVMGRKTHQSLGRALPGRTNIVVTRQENYSAPDCIVVQSIDEALSCVSGAKEVFFIGGAEIFAEILPRADRLYVTLIHAEFEGDAYFPQVDTKTWQIVGSEKGIVNERNQYEHDFLIFDRSRK